jgi:hypothetical protein
MPCDPFKQNHKRTTIESLLKMYEDLDGDTVFLSIGNIVPWDNDNDPPTANDSIKSDTDFWRRVFAHKRIDRRDVSLVVRRYDWEAGKTYTAYRDDVDLFDDFEPAQFYVLVDEERVYKCIDNNNNSPSLIPPIHTDSEIRKLSDGYRWKFLYQIPESKRKFLTKSQAGAIGYMPVEYVENLRLSDERFLQWNIQQAAVDGEIAFIQLSPEIKPFVRTTKCVYPSDENIIVLSASAGATGVYISSPTMIPRPGYYEDMVFSVDSNSGQGQRRRIVSFNPTGGPEQAFVTLDDPLSIGLAGGANASTFSIVPNIKVEGDGFANNNQYNPYAKTAEVLVRFGATAEIQTDSDCSGCDISVPEIQRLVDSFELVDGGKDYTFATTSVVAGLIPLKGSLDGLSIPVMSPPGGHGSNPVKELGCSSLMIVSDFERDEGGDISVENEFRQVGIIKNPLLADPQYRLKFYEPGLELSFTVGETAGQSGSSVYGTVESWYPGVTGFTGTAELVLRGVQGGSFSVGSSVDDFRIFSAEKREVAGTEGRSLLRLNVVPAPPYTAFVGTGVDFRRGLLANGIGDYATSIPPSRAIGEVYRWEPTLGSNKSGLLYLENMQGEFKIGEKLNQLSPATGVFTYGLSGVAKITEIASEVQGGNAVYDQTTTMVIGWNGTNLMYDGSFQEDDFTTFNYGTTSFANGYVMDWKQESGTTGTLRISGTQGKFYQGMTVNYKSSAGLTHNGTVSSILHTGELVYRSGDILYIQNTKPIQRRFDQKEEIKIVIDF